MERIDDKLDACGRQFTDGIGKISPAAMREVSQYVFVKIDLNEHSFLILGLDEIQPAADRG